MQNEMHDALHCEWNLIWNDVALLTDQRACTFLCKTMLQIRTEDEIALQEITLNEWRRDDMSEQDILSGEMKLQLCFVNQQSQISRIPVDIPLQGQLTADVMLGEARLLYRRGELADDKLLLETVLQIPRELELQRTQVMVGQFAMEEQLKLPDEWPDCAEVLTTAAVAEVQSFAIQQQMLHIEGVHHLTVVYADDRQNGENLFAYEQHRAFTWRAAVPSGLQELTGVQPYYQSLAVQLLDDHCVQLTGSGVLCTLPSETDAAITLRESEQEYSTVQTEKQEQEPCEDVCPYPVQQAPSVVNCRGSRRAKLNKYMRDLNGMVQSPTSVRNFDIRNMDSEEDENAATKEV